MSEEKILAVKLERIEGYSFKVDFGENIEALMMDEIEPVGGKKGPNATMLLAAAMGNCLSTSLLFCLQKTRTPVKGMRTRVQAKTTRNEKGRLRIVGIQVEITPKVDHEYSNQFNRCLPLFEEYCTVSKSVEQGIPFELKVVWPSS
jgi:uncharacterized OsmC-like protein